MKLELEGFGKFAKDTSVDFDNGINFITGLNEAGKSTILEAIMASIFKYTRTQIEQFLCWKNKDTCRTALTYKTDGGEIFRIISDYKSGKRKLEKIEKSKIKEIASVDKNIDPVLKEHFGFDDKKVFENTAFIRQSQMSILEDNSVKNKIKDMVEEVFAGRAEASATKALAKMKKVAKDSSKEKDELENERKDLKEKMKSAEDTKESVVKDSGEFDKVKKKLEEKSRELERLQKNKKLFDEKEKLMREKEHIEEQMEKVEELVETLSEEKRVPIQTSSKTFAFILIVAGVLVSLTIIGVVIGLPLIIWGIMKLRQKDENPIPRTRDDERLVKYQKESKSLINKKAVNESRLEEYKLVNFNINDFDDLKKLESEVDVLKSKKVELQTTIKTTTSLVESPEEIREKLDVIEERISDINKRIEEYNLAARFLEMAETSVQQKFTPMIEKNSKNILNEITDGRYSDLKINEDNLDIVIKPPEVKEYVDAFFLSQGARDQLYFALRTAMSDLLSGSINIPLILDDPFHNFDNVRLAKTIGALKQIAKNKQIILISHRPYHHEFSNFSKNVLELSK